MGQFYSSFQTLLTEDSDAAKAYRKRQAEEQKKSYNQHMSQRDRADRWYNSRKTSSAGRADIDSAEVAKEKEMDSRISKRQQSRKGTEGRRKATDNLTNFKNHVGDYDDEIDSTRSHQVSDAISRHNRRHPDRKLEQTDYGIFSSLITEGQIEDTDE